jgi:hypothetical protein
VFEALEQATDICFPYSIDVSFSSRLVELTRAATMYLSILETRKNGEEVKMDKFG